MSFVKASVVLCCVVLPATASAQAFPADSAYIPLRCGDAPMRDGVQDQAGALEERDIVGNTDEPAGLRAADDTYLYLRMRLEEDPGTTGSVRPYAWGMQFDLDGDLNTYEIMVAAEGIAGAAGTVAVYRNTTTTLRNDPNDPPDLPEYRSYAFSANARTTVAPGSDFGGNGDFFLTIAVPWSDLAGLNLGRDTRTFVWAASSSTTNGLNGDLACHDGVSGPGRLDVTASDGTTGDPTRDPDGDGNPGGGVGRLEGGGGCSAGAGNQLGAGAGAGARIVTPAALALALLALRRRRQGKRGAIDRSA